MTESAPVTRPCIQEVTVDCTDGALLAEFWGRLLERPWGYRDGIGGVVDAGPLWLYFQQVPEPKQSAKNRLHVDIEVDELNRGIRRAEALGARRIGEIQRPGDDGGFVVMQDPEANEFCLVTQPRGSWTALLRSIAGQRPGDE